MRLGTEYLAGLLEGEGTFVVNRSSQAPSSRGRNVRDSMQVVLRMADRDILEKALDIFPAKARIGEENPNVHPSTIARQEACGSTATCRTIYHARWSGQEAEDLMKMILPYMGVRRKAKIEECLNTPNLSHQPREAVCA